jgi:hypothetical protein
MAIVQGTLIGNREAYGAGGVAVGRKTASVNSTAPGVVYTLTKLLGSTSTFALVSGTNANLSLTGGVNITAASPIGSGNSQTAVVQETMTVAGGSVKVEYPIILTGQTSMALTTDYDLVIYGATPGAITAAYEARRRGLTVCIVGGWRERRLGGMMSGGLGYTDLNNKSAMGGLAREFFYQTNVLAGDVTDTRTNYPYDTYFEPEFARTVFENWMATYSVPVFYSGGLTSLTKTGTRITSITVQAGGSYIGRTVSGTYFVDATYEGDLLAMAGVSFTVGREASDANNTSNGWRQLGNPGHEFFGSSSSVILPISPFNVEGDSNSGLLPTIMSDPGLVSGAGPDNAVMAYCFRQTATNVSTRKTAMPNTAPAGYSPANYELLFRWLKARTDAGLTTTLSQVITPGTVGSSTICDVNNAGPVSLNLLDRSNWAYPTATYAEREVIWKKHEAWQRGFWYALQYEPDSRVPAALRTSALAWGYVVDHYTTGIHENDQAYWPTQLYVREARRMVSDFIMQGTDISATDNTNPRSGKIIAAGSYTQDSHHNKRYADFTTGTWRVWNEGQFQGSGGGTNNIFVIPYDVTIPKASECTNLWVSFCMSATHNSFGALRLESNHMAIGQAIGCAAAICKAAGNIDVQNMDYNTFRTALLAAPDATPPVAPLLN